MGGLKLLGGGGLSEAEVKALAEGVLGTLNAFAYKGAKDCSANPKYPAANAGDTYIISVAGKIGGASGTAVEVGDLLLCKTDGSAEGTQAEVGAKWDVVQTNLVVGAAGEAGKVLAADDPLLSSVVSGSSSSSTPGNLADFTDSAGRKIGDSGVNIEQLLGAAAIKMAPAGDGLTALGTNTDAPLAAYTDPSYAVSNLRAGVRSTGSFIQTPTIAINPTTGAIYVACRWVEKEQVHKGEDLFGKGVIQIAKITDSKGQILPATSITWTTIAENAADCRSPKLDFLANGALVLTYLLDIYNTETGGVSVSGTGNLKIQTLATGLDPTVKGNWSAGVAVPGGFTKFETGSPSGFLEPDPINHPGEIVVFLVGSSEDETFTEKAYVGTICTTVSSAGTIGAWSTPVKIVKGTTVSKKVNEPTMAVDNAGNWIMMIRDNTSNTLFVTKRTAADISEKGISAAEPTWSAAAQHLTTIYGGPNLRALSDGTLILTGRASTALKPWESEAIGVYSTCLPGEDATSTAKWATPQLLDSRFKPSAYLYGQVRELPQQPGMFVTLYAVIETTSTNSNLFLRAGTRIAWGQGPNGAVFAPAVYSNGDLRSLTGARLGPGEGALVTSAAVNGEKAGPWTESEMHVPPGSVALNTSGGIVAFWRADVVAGLTRGSVHYLPNYSPGFDITTGFPSGNAGILAKTLEDASMADTDLTSVLVTGDMLFFAVRLAAGQVYTSVTFHIGETIGSPTHQWAYLTDKNGKILAVSTDKTTTAFTAHTPKTYTFAAPATALATAIGYVGLMVSGTVPSLFGKSSNKYVLGSTDRGAARAGLNAGGFTTAKAVGETFALTLNEVSGVPLAYLK